MANGSMVAVLSDIHIGNDENTCWYQRSVHEPYLLDALNWIADNASMLQEVILLGDLVDTWTYAPSVTPPTMAEIVAANPNVLGSSGALANVVKAVPKVTYLLGNHDGTLTSADIAALQGSVGQIEMVEPVHVLTGSTGARTVFSHGHYWTMFNAPDPNSPWNTLPVGHFVTRAFSYMMAKQLAGTNKTVADFPNMGYPNGIDILAFIEHLLPNFSPDIPSLLLNYVSGVSGMSDSEPITLPDGKTKTTIAEARTTYANLFTEWETKDGTQNAGRAALADSSGVWLAWFAQRLAIQQGADLCVMGHTHTPVGGLGVSSITYYNSGFECASGPDMSKSPPALFTFTLVDLDQPAAEIFSVTPGSDPDIATVPALPSAVIQPPSAADMSCFVRILNKSAQPLTLTGTPAASHGYWVVPPPQTIPAGGRGDGWLQDYAGAKGSAGTFSYQGAGDFSVSCPTGVVQNTVSGAGGNFIARSAGGAWSFKGNFPAWGHPLQVIFTVGG
jgi:UDP-2,3-diacylglucosamine pyrophosphatase LpxH